jgi:hypothetical protein
MVDTLCSFFTYFLIRFIIADLFPLYGSLKTYKQHSDAKMLDSWLKYWVVRSFLVLGEYLAWSYLEKYCINRLDYMYPIRMLLYLLLVTMDLSSQIFDYAVHPALVANESIIDETLEKVWTYGTTFLGFVIRKAKELALQGVVSFFISSRSRNE